MLQWGLQHFHGAGRKEIHPAGLRLRRCGTSDTAGAPLYVPRRPDQRPNQEFLADRYAIFQRAH